MRGQFRLVKWGLFGWKLHAEDKFVNYISYRPFDRKYVYYDSKIIERPREKIMQHFIKGGNIGLVIGRQGQVVGSMPWNLSFITNSMTDFNLYYRGGGVVFPLFQYNTYTDITSDKIPNLNEEIAKQIAKCVNAEYVPDLDERIYGMPPEGYDPTKEISPLDILDYIYAVLHSPTYREKYKEFLKIDFPRVPYPKDKETFWKLVELGSEIRQIHLLESPKVEQYITQYPIDGDNLVTKVRFVPYTYENEIPDKDGKITYPDYLGCVYINDTQYFADVPTSAWEFYIGGYQPAQKWLKDRKDRKLEFEDILHYQKIIVALFETDRLMKEIDKIDFID